MATTQIRPSVVKGQRAVTAPAYINRILPAWTTPEWVSAENWRKAVRNQPYAMACRDTLIMNVLSLEWIIVARDSALSDELKGEIEYYTDLIRNIDNEGYDVFADPMLQNMLDIPFGGGCEIIREGDQPNGRALAIRYVDGATCFPTYNLDYPVVQQTTIINPGGPEFVPFPKHAFARIYMSPRPELRRRGWGMAPPEKIYMALELLYRGDKYYANLLLDTPEVGILDLGSTSEDTATKFLDSWKTLLSGIDPFKVPVLYEHDSETKFISFTRSPQEMLFDKAIARYAMITAAGYGMAVTDIGDMTLAATSLAATIRQERRSKRTGIGTVMTKWKLFWDRILPKELEFKYIDRDDETMVSRGRARLANSLAFGNMITNATLTPRTVLQQMVADGMVTVPVNVETEVAAAAELVAQQQKPDQLIRNTLGDTQPASKGGEGDVTARRSVVLPQSRARRYAKIALNELKNTISAAKSNISGPEMAIWRAATADFALGTQNDFAEIPEIASALQLSKDRVAQVVIKDGGRWLDSALDRDRIVGDLARMYSIAVRERTENLRESAFEDGKPEPVISITAVPDLVDRLKTRADEVAAQYRQALGEAVGDIATVTTLQFAETGDDVDVVTRYIEQRVTSAFPGLETLITYGNREWIESLVGVNVREESENSNDQAQ